MAARISHAPPSAAAETAARLRALVVRAAPMVASRAGLAAMAITDAVMLAHWDARELAAATLAEGTFGRLTDVLATFFLAGIVLVAAARGGAGRAERIAHWRRSVVLAAVLGLATLAAAPLAEPLLLALGQDPPLAARSARVVLVLAAGLPAALVAVATAVHLEAIGRAGLVALWLLAANLVNVALNWLLIGGGYALPAMGAEGSALATSIVRAGLALGLVATLVAYEGPALLRARVGWFRGTGDQFRIGATASAAGATMHVLGVWLTVFAGWLGTIPLAAYAGSWLLCLPGILLAAGVGDALAIRVAGTGRDPAVRTVLRRDLAALAALLVLYAAAALIAPGLVARLYTPDPRLAAMLASLLPMTAVALVLDGLGIAAAAALRARRDVGVPTAIQLATMAATPVLAALLVFPLGHGVHGLLAAILVTSTVRLVLLAWRLVMVFGDEES